MAVGIQYIIRLQMPRDRAPFRALGDRGIRGRGRSWPLKWCMPTMIARYAT